MTNISEMESLWWPEWDSPPKILQNLLTEAAERLSCQIQPVKNAVHAADAPSGANEVGEFDVEGPVL